MARPLNASVIGPGRWRSKPCGDLAETDRRFNLSPEWGTGNLACIDAEWALGRLWGSRSTSDRTWAITPSERVLWEWSSPPRAVLWRQTERPEGDRTIAAPGLWGQVPVSHPGVMRTLERPLGTAWGEAMSRPPYDAQRAAASIHKVNETSPQRYTRSGRLASALRFGRAAASGHPNHPPRSLRSRRQPSSAGTRRMGHAHWQAAMSSRLLVTRPRRTMASSGTPLPSVRNTTIVCSLAR